MNTFSTLLELGFKWDTNTAAYIFVRHGIRVRIEFHRETMHVLTITAEGVQEEAKFTAGLSSPAVQAFITTLIGKK